MDMYDDNFYKNACDTMITVMRGLEHATDEIDNTSGQIASNVANALQRSHWDDLVGVHFKQTVIEDARKHVKEFLDLYGDSLKSSIEEVQRSVEAFQNALDLWRATLDYKG